MSEFNVTDVLVRGLQKYGELAVVKSNVQNLLERHSITESIHATGITLGHLKEAVIANGDILEENIEEQSYIAVVRTGHMNATRALVAAVLRDDGLYFAAYAKEGLIKQCLAQKAIDSIKKQLI